ncbi:MAG TPA: GNAT family N-acetyltransferase [Ktedonobacteraceae bacterium]|nr:GNAT family N-acetyltransferase [Ktedonobacteraceae bacterium]
MQKSRFQTLIPLFDELQGERVIVRPYHKADAQALYEAVAESRDYLRLWLPFADEHQSVEESLNWIIHQEAAWLLRESLPLSVWERASGHFLGGSGVHIHNWETRSFEIGYWLRASATAHGYMIEAARLVTDYLFNELAATRVEIRCDERNTRSAAIPRRLGYVQEGRLRNHMPAPDGTLRTTLIFSMIPEDRVKSG